MNNLPEIKNKEVSEKDQKRFLDKIDIKGENDCWNWNAGLRNKYGCFRYKKENWKSNRFSYWLFNGSLKRSLFVLHSCDNPLCCNPKHLRMGNHQENMNDMKKKTRGSIISRSDVEQIMFVWSDNKGIRHSKTFNYKSDRTKEEALKLAEDYRDSIFS